MEAEVVQLRSLDGCLPGAPKGVPVATPEYVALGTVRPTASQHSVSVGAQGNLTAMATLGHFQADDTPRPVHALPGQAEGFPATTASEHGELHQVHEGKVAALVAGIEQPSSFLWGQPPQSALWLFLQLHVGNLGQRVQ